MTRTTTIDTDQAFREMITGRPPLQADELESALAVIAFSQPVDTNNGVVVERIQGDQ